MDLSRMHINYAVLDIALSYSYGIPKLTLADQKTGLVEWDIYIKSTYYKCAVCFHGDSFS